LTVCTLDPQVFWLRVAQVFGGSAGFLLGHNLYLRITVLEYNASEYTIYETNNQGANSYGVGE
jgi:hypothetical protein